MVGGGERERRGQVVTWNSAATAHRGGDTRGGTRTVSGTCDLHVWCAVGWRGFPGKKEKVYKWVVKKKLGEVVNNSDV